MAPPLSNIPNAVSQKAQAHPFPTGPRLNYAPAPPWHHRRRFRKVLLAFLLVTVAAGYWRWHAPLLAHARLVYWQHECANHMMAPDEIVASTDGPAKSAAKPMPPAWISYAAQCLSTTTASASFRNPAFLQTIAFLHARRSPAGHERIVAVRCIVMYLSSASVVQAFQPVVVEPAKPWPLASRPILHDGLFPGGYPIHMPVRVFGGQPDPADASHFTIAYTVNDLPGVIDGRLGDNDTVKLSVRPGSADVIKAFVTQPPAPQIADIAREYKKLQSMTRDAVFVNPELAMLCRGASWQDVEGAKVTSGPHANTRVRIYMNDLAAKAFRASSPKYPVGSVIVKQKQGEGYFDKTRKTVQTPDGVGGMVKRAPGFDADHGDWEYFYFQDASRIESGKIPSCVQCHAGAAKDHVFGSWAKG
ncbi:MAG TPA: cytochrome P460 family protein [Tepidisphaeraceae bacterium]|nr:cytochrome P460 family protein [Tepidisphaeraceae bacterium]